MPTVLLLLWHHRNHHKKYVRHKLSLALLGLEPSSLIDYQNSDSVVGQVLTFFNDKSKLRHIASDD